MNAFKYLFKVFLFDASDMKILYFPFKYIPFSIWKIQIHFEMALKYSFNILAMVPHSQMYPNTRGTDANICILRGGISVQY